jgi:hypothetical protein
MYLGYCIVTDRLQFSLTRVLDSNNRMSSPAAVRFSLRVVALKNDVSTAKGAGLSVLPQYI